MLYVEEVLKDIIENVVSPKLLPQLTDLDRGYKGVNFLYGKPAEIIGTLANKTKSETEKYSKYPLVALFFDFPEKLNPRSGIEVEATLSGVICTSNTKYKETVKSLDYSFKSVLVPILETLQDAIVKDARIAQKRVIDLEMKITRRPYWGSGMGLKYYSNGKENIFADYLDAIEFENLKIELFNEKMSCKK